MLTIAELMNDKSDPIEVNIGSETDKKIITVTFNPSAMTPAKEAEIYANNGGSVGSVYVKMLSTLLLSWDLAGDDGEELPINADNLALIPINVLELIIVAINEAQRLPKSTAPASQSSFVRAGASRRNIN